MAIVFTPAELRMLDKLIREGIKSTNVYLYALPRERQAIVRAHDKISDELRKKGGES